MEGRDHVLRYKEIKYQIEQMISHMHADEPLPSRESLCRSLDTTRATLHKAISELSREGKLYTRGGSGTYVAGTRGTMVNKNRFVGLIIPHSEPNYRDLICGVEAYLQSQDINLVLSYTDGDIEKQNLCITRMLQSGVSGLIVVPAYCMDITRDYVLFSRLEQQHMPVVFCYRGIESVSRIPLVAYNNFYSAWIATKHLIAKGYRHITYVAQFLLRTTLDRYQGYLAAMMEEGLEIDRSAIIFDAKHDDQEPLAYRETLNMLESHPEVDAILCNADSIAEGIYQAIRDSGRRVSQDIGVISINNDTIKCNMLHPTLTSVGGPNQVIGEKAAQMLLKIIQGENPQTPLFLFQSELYERESCLGPLVDEHEILSQARALMPEWNK